jgi:hypothetical protein
MRVWISAGAILVSTLPSYADQIEKDTPGCKSDKPVECIATFPWNPSSGTGGVSAAIKEEDYTSVIKDVDQQQLIREQLDEMTIKLPKF